jgi:hypothetical protein
MDPTIRKLRDAAVRLRIRAALIELGKVYPGVAAVLAQPMPATPERAYRDLFADEQTAAALQALELATRKGKRAK